MTPPSLQDPSVAGSADLTSVGVPPSHAIQHSAEGQLPWFARRSTGAGLLAAVTVFLALTVLEAMEVSSPSLAVAARSPEPAAISAIPDAPVSVPARGTSAVAPAVAAAELSGVEAEQAASSARTDRRREERKLALVRRQVAEARVMYERLQRAAVASAPLAGQLPAPNALAGTGPLWVSPVTAYRVTARFGDTGRLWSRSHTGLDMAAPTGTPVMAVAGGTVSFAGVDGPYGLRVAVTHADGTETWYARMSRVDVTAGAAVAPGAPLGAVGATGNVSGPHLHLEVRPPGGEPVDPMVALSEHGVTV